MSRERIDHAVLFLKSISQTPSGGDSQVFFLAQGRNFGASIKVGILLFLIK